MKSLRALTAVLLRREIGAAWLVSLVAVVVVAVWIATQTATIDTATVRITLALRLLRRFDLMLLAAGALWSSLRVAQVLADDAASGWTEVYYAACYQRVSHLAVVVAVVVIPRFGWFVLGAVAFAIGTYLSNGSMELLMLLPTVLAAGLLLIGCITSYVASFAIVLSRVTAALVGAALVAAAPLGVFGLYMVRDDGDQVPALVSWWAALGAPPFRIASSVAELLLQVCYFTAVQALLLVLSRRYVGQRA